MTDLRKSDAQLDAEAATPLEERDLDAAIRAHRLLYGMETGILRLHQRDGDDQGLGPPFNYLFADFLDANYHALPWHRSLDHLRGVCGALHTKHFDDLCFGLVSLVVRYGFSVDYAHYRLALTDEGKTRRCLDSALLTIERRLETLLSEDRARQTYERPASEWMASAHIHRHPPGSSLEDCPQCRAA